MALASVQTRELPLGGLLGSAVPGVNHITQRGHAPLSPLQVLHRGVTTFRSRWHQLVALGQSSLQEYRAELEGRQTTDGGITFWTATSYSLGILLHGCSYGHGQLDIPRALNDGFPAEVVLRKFKPRQCRILWIEKDKS
jgi:hypothetical protein